jgi:AcrR family transcriptional regulator
MPRPKAAHQELYAAQRMKILNAARIIFARKGMAATIDDVAAEAGISHGLAYRYFANKETLFRALVEQALQADPAGLLHVLDMRGTPGERLALLLSKLVESRRDQSEFHQFFDQVLNSEATPDHLRETIQKRGQTFLDVMRKLIMEGQATGEFATGDPDQFVLTIAACLEGLTRLALLNPEHFKKHCPDTEMLMRILKP